MTTRLFFRTLLFWPFFAWSLVACETKTTSSGDSAVCVPVTGELCVAPLTVWVEESDLLREVIGTGACSFPTPGVSGGLSKIDGVIHKSGPCHIVATSTSGATEEQDVEVGELVQSAYCGCANYPKAGALGVLAFSKRKPTIGSDGICQCAANRYCYAGATMCTSNVATSQCLLRPSVCGEEVQSVCGCDGKIYANECLARQAGSDIALAGSCDLPATHFACGNVICVREEQICRMQYAPQGSYESYRCEDGLACRKAFSDTCGCPSPTGCTCETSDAGAVICKIKL